MGRLLLPGPREPSRGWNSKRTRDIAEPTSRDGGNGIMTKVQILAWRSARLACLVALIEACQPVTPKPPWKPQPRAWDQPNPQCPGTSTLVAYCCSCSPVDEQIANRMRALNFSAQLGKGFEDCVSTQMHQWRTSSAVTREDEGANYIVNHCTRQTETRDPRVMQALVEVVQEIFRTKPDAVWEQCYSSAITRGSCQRIEEALARENAEHERHIADEKLEHEQQMARDKAQTENLTRAFTAMGAMQGGYANAASGATWGHGLNGSTRVGFMMGGVQHIAVISLQGNRGYADVINLATNEAVREDLAADTSSGSVLLIGSNPRDAATGAANHDYAPDAFQLVPAAGGQWRVVQICDAVGGCAPTTILN